MNDVVIFGNKKETLLLVKHMIGIGATVSLITLSRIALEKYNISGYEESLIAFCKEKSIPLIEVDDYSLINENMDTSVFSNAIVGFACGWQRIIPNNILEKFNNGVFGWHGSMFNFPNGRGRSPINWSIRLGGKRIYHNCFQLGGGVDDGPIFETKKIRINKLDYVNDVIDKANRHIISSAEKIYNILLKKQKPELLGQNNNAYILFPKLSEFDGELNSNTMSAKDALNIIRSCSRPFPGAYFIKNNKKIIVWKAKRIHYKFGRNNERIVSFKDGMLLIKESSLVEFDRDE